MDGLAHLGLDDFGEAEEILCGVTPSGSQTGRRAVAGVIVSPCSAGALFYRQARSCDFQRLDLQPLVVQLANRLIRRYWVEFHHLCRGSSVWF
jgi:hypothetical protein